MKIVLNQEVKGVGKPGDIKEVADGFAQNFLIPNGLAVPATKEAINRAEKIIEEEKETSKKELEETQKTAAEIDGKEIIIKEKAEDGKLFGSISADNIVEELSKQKIKIIKNNVDLKDPIKEIGEYKIKIKLDHGLESEVKIIIEEA